MATFEPALIRPLTAAVAMSDGKTKFRTEDADSLLRTAGLRRTFSRVHVLVGLAQIGKPATHAQIATHLERHGFDASTIFRCLNDLTAAGLLKRTDFGDHIWRFELRSSTNVTRPDEIAPTHLVCNVCGETARPEDGIYTIQRQDSHKQSTWRLEEVVARGTCPKCRGSDP